MRYLPRLVTALLVGASALVSTGSVEASFATYEELAALNGSTLDSVLVKVTYVGSRLRVRQTLVIATHDAAVDVGRFAPFRRLAEPPAYVGDERESVVGLVSRTEMDLLIENMGTVPAMRNGEMDPGGFVSISLVAPVGGEEKGFEAILHRTAAKAVLAKVLESLVTNGSARDKVRLCACQYDLVTTTPPNEVTSQVAVKLSGSRYVPALDLYVSTMTVKNTTGSGLSGPLTIVLVPKENVEILDFDGVTCATDPAYAIYRTIQIPSLAAGQSVDIPYRVRNPDKVSQAFHVIKVYSGAGDL